MNAGRVIQRVWAREMIDGRILSAGRYIQLQYDQADPYAVILAEHGPGSGQLPVARDVLEAGLRLGAAGEPWALRVNLRCPAREPVLALEASDAGVHLALSPRAVAAFLARTSALVPYGRESHWANVDSELAEVLGAA
jgi:hypothetical protein